MHPLCIAWIVCVPWFLLPVPSTLCKTWQLQEKILIKRKLPGERNKYGCIQGCFMILGSVLWLLSECAEFAFFWTMSCLLDFTFCAWLTHNWIKGSNLKLIEYHKFISAITGGLYGEPGTKTSETYKSVIKLSPLDKHQLIFLCCPLHWPSWFSPFPAASPLHFQWDRWEQTASPLLLQQSTCL